MNRQNNNYLKSFIVAFTVLVSAVACRHDNSSNDRSPAWHIAESEKLVIPAAVDLPANLPAGNTRVLTLFAEGVQKYKAQVKAGTSDAYEWVFVAPEADLYNAANLKVGKHYAGPTWRMTEFRTDSIVAQQFSPVRSAVSAESNTIDWLQLMPKTGKTPSGIFSRVAYIQRIATNGGKAPAKLPVSLADTVDVKYTAIYRFSEKN
jgi:Protein of unknown function (DUF3455)